MSKNRPDRETAPVQSGSGPAQQKKAPGTNRPVPWHPLWRFVLSGLLVFHVLAVASAPWYLSSEPALPPGYVLPLDAQGRAIPPEPNSNVLQQPLLQRTLWEFFTPYLNLLYLNHGYEFFAPHPNGCHLIRYRIYDSGGTEIAQGEFPNLKEQWPRLYYHRHMMLAAQTGMMGEESGRSYARHLLRVHRGQTCRLDLVFHRLLLPQQVADGVALDDPSTYHVEATIQETAAPQNQSATGEQRVSIPEAGRP